MNLTVSNTNRILRSGNGPTVEYTGQDPIQVNNATHIISLNPTFSSQFAESGVEAKVDELSSCCEQVHSSISSLSSTVETISSELPDLEPYATKEWVEDQGYLTQVPDGYLTKGEAGGGVNLTATTLVGNTQNQTQTYSTTGTGSLVYNKTITTTTQNDYSISGALSARGRHKSPTVSYGSTATYVATATTGTWTATGIAP